MPVLAGATASLIGPKPCLRSASNSGATGIASFPTTPLSDAIEMTIAGRRQYWLSEAIVRITAQAEPCLSVDSKATGSRDQVVHSSAIPQPEPTTGEVDPRAAIDAFIARVNQIGSKSTRKDFWTVAGYTNATEFERFQRRDPRATPSAANNFNRVLKMKPDDFIRRRDLLREKRRP